MSNKNPPSYPEIIKEIMEPLFEKNNYPILADYEEAVAEWMNDFYEFGENDSTIETPVEKEGRINLNSRFLLDALNALEEKDIQFEFSSHIAPILLKNKQNNKYTHIIMPLNS